MSNVDDARLDAALQAFLGERAKDTATVRDAGEMALAIGRADRSGGRTASIRLAWLVVALALLGAVAVGAAILGGAPPVVRLDAMTVTAVPAPTPSHSLAPTPTPPPVPRSATEGDGPTLTWSRIDVDGAARVASFGGRFYVGGPGMQLLESEDGIEWRQVGDQEPAAAYGRIVTSSLPFSSFGGDVVQWDPDSGDSVVRVVRPPAPVVESRELDRHDDEIIDAIFAMGIGPAGIVAMTQTRFDYERFVVRKLGQDWYDKLASYDLRQGRFFFRTHDGRTAWFNVGDAGLAATEALDASSAWHSADGRSWTRLSAYHSPIWSSSHEEAQIVGTADGFLMLNRSGRMSHSTDGTDWSYRLGDRYPIGPGWSFLPWRSGALATDGANRFDLWTADGRSSLPLTASLPERDPSREQSAAGPLGIVVVDPDRAEVLFSPDGSAWSLAPMSPEMARSAPGGPAVDTPSVAVGSDAVVVVLVDEEGSSVWRGTIAP